MSKDELARVAAHLTEEDLGELLDAYFHARHRTNQLTLTVEARRLDTSSLLERIDFDGQLNSFALSL